MANPIAATITGVNLNWAGQTIPFLLATPITNYMGDELFLKAISDGQTLSITIDDAGPNVLKPSLAARTATVTMTYLGQTPAPVRMPAGYTFNYNAEPLAFSLGLTGDLAEGAVTIQEQRPAGNPVALGYIVVRDPNDYARVVMSWVIPPVPIANYAALHDASIIPPAPLDPHTGGIHGPLGIELT